jgi:hypothetical protein
MRMHDILFLIIIIRYAVNRLVKDIDIGGSKLPRAHATLEQKIQLGKGTALGLGYTEVSVYNAEEADAGLRRCQVCKSWLDREYLPRRNQ